MQAYRVKLHEQQSIPGEITYPFYNQIIITDGIGQIIHEHVVKLQYSHVVLLFTVIRTVINRVSVIAHR